jgi:hypothetical protein
MTEDEFEYKLRKLFQDKVNKLQDITLKLTHRLQNLPVKYSIKKQIESEIKNKIYEYANDEKENILKIASNYEQQIAIILSKEYIIDEYREILLGLVRDNHIDNIQAIQNNMMSLRMEYIEFNLLTRESFYRNIINCNETVAEANVKDKFIGEEMSFDDHHGDSSI